MSQESAQDLGYLHGARASAVFLSVGLALAACSKEPAPASPDVVPIASTSAVATPATVAPAASSVAPAATPSPAQAAAPSASDAPLPPGRAPHKEGEICSGFGGFRCEKGLHCEIAPPVFPDKSGVCKK